MDAGTKHLPWMFLILPTPCPNLFTTEACCYTHSRKERQYITYLRDHIHTRTIYFLKVNYLKLSIHRHFDQTLPGCTHPCPHVGQNIKTDRQTDRLYVMEFCMQTLSRISPNRDLAVDGYNSISIYRNLAVMQLLCL